MKTQHHNFSNKPFIISAVISVAGYSILIFGSTYFANYLQKHLEVKVFFGILGSSLILAGGFIAVRYMKRVEDYNKSHGIFKNPISFWKK